MEITSIDNDTRPLTRVRSPRKPRNTVRRLLDAVARTLSAAAALGTALLVAVVSVLLLQKAWPLLVHASLWQLLMGQVWEPHNGLFGFAPFIAGTVAVTFVAMVLAVVPAVLSGVYVAEYTSAQDPLPAQADA